MDELEQMRNQLKQVRQERDEALERTLQFDELIQSLTNDLAKHFRLTYNQSIVFGALRRWNLVSRDQLMALLYGARTNPPHDKIIDIYIHQVRKKLTPHGIEIVTTWNLGWSLSNESKKTLEAMEATVSLSEEEGELLNAVAALYEEWASDPTSEEFNKALTNVFGVAAEKSTTLMNHRFNCGMNRSLKKRSG